MTKIFHKLPRRHQQLLLAIALVMTVLFLLPSDQTEQQSSSGLKVATRYSADIVFDQTPTNANPTFNKLQPAAIPALKTASAQRTEAQVTEEVTQQTSAQTLPPPLSWKKVTVKSGDNLGLIFNRAGFSANTLYKITSLGSDTKALTKIMPGQTLNFGTDDQQQLVKLTYHQDIVTSLEVSKLEGKYQAKKIVRELETREHIVSAAITSNFWNAAAENGLSDGLIMNLAQIFGWDIDFGLDIREGDQFSLIYETKYLDGIAVKTGNIIAAEFVNRGQSYQAIRASNDQYYSATGRSMRKAFLRSPVNFKYISSGFNPRRLHPVTKTVKPHRGIDYAAKTGTPVVASGSGTVIASSYNKYNGNYVVIKHGERYVTKYLHLSKRYVKKGARVKQGDRIGNVGSTGRVTGAHLHYEFLVNGVHRNPRTVKLPKSQAIAKKDRGPFLTLAGRRMEQLNANKRVMLASF